MAIRIYGILNTAANLTFSGDIAGSLDELRLVFDEVLGRLKDGATDAGAECAVKGLVKLSPFKKSEILAQIIFDFIVWDGKLIWDLIKLPGSPTVLLVYTPATPTATPTPTQISYELPPLNRQDYYSVLQWVKYALETNDVDVFIKLVAENLAYVLYPEGGEDVTKDEFLRDLSKRLPSGPRCDSYTISGNTLDIQVSRWSPAWIIDEMCYGGCGPINPPITSNVIAFSFRKENNGWRLNKIALGERPDWWASTYNTPIVSCDTVQISSSTSFVAQNLDGLLPLNAAEYFSVLQWIKYASLNNDISVFEELIVGNSIELIDGDGKATTISEVDFLEELSKRLLNKPNCNFFMFEESGRLVIRISNWSPGWGVGGDTIVYLILEQKNNQWVLTSIIYGDHPPSWAQGLERINYDTISLSAGITTDAACKEARPTRLKIDDFAFVSFYPPLVQRVRSSYGVTSPIIDRIPLGTAVKILDGPECADNMVWWKIRVLNSGSIGWTSEGDSDAYYLIPCESRENCGTQ